MEDLAVTLREMAEADGWEAVVDGSLGPEVSSEQEHHGPVNVPDLHGA